MLTLALAAMLAVSVPPPPELGTPFRVIAVDCAVQVVAKQYELTDSDVTSLHLRRYHNWWALVVETNTGEVHLWIDHDMDGKPDEYEVWGADEFFETYQSPCDLLDAILVV